MAKANLSNNKGAAFERKICVELSLWVSNGKRKDLYWRTAMSGGRAAIVQGVEQYGDITCVSGGPGAKLTDRYVIECKHRKDLNSGLFFREHKGPLKSIYLKLMDEAETAGKYPLLIWKDGRAPVMVTSSRITCVDIPTIDGDSNYGRCGADPYGWQDGSTHTIAKWHPGSSDLVSYPMSVFMEHYIGKSFL